MNPFEENTQALVNRAAQVLSDLGVAAYLVGGAIRDGLLGKTTNDVDIVVMGSASELSHSLAEALDGHDTYISPRHDIARIIVGKGASAVTIDILSLSEGGIEDDLRRRDFTINSIAAPLDSVASGSWDLLDRFGRLRDFRERKIRASSDSVFSDDPVRLLRAVRICAETDFEIEPATQTLIRRDAHRLSEAPAERIRDEFFKILATPDCARRIRMMDRLGLLSVLIPELDCARGVEQPKEHYYDVFGHLMATLDYADQIVTGHYSNGLARDMMPAFDGMKRYFKRDFSHGHTRGTLLKLTAMLHDVAKPNTKTVEPSGRIRFFGHSERGEEIAGDILSRLRVSRNGAEAIRGMIRHHLRPRQMSNKGDLPTDRAIHRYYRDLGNVALDTLYLNMADFLAARGPLLTEVEMRHQTEVIGHIMAVGPQKPITIASNRGLLTGHDIMREFQIESGPLVGQLLKAVAGAEALGEIKTKEEALKLARASLRTGVAGG